MPTREDIYDEQIAPILLEAGKIAKEHGIDLLACVDISSEDHPYGTVEIRCIDMSKAHAAMRLIQFAILAKGNVDSLMMELVKDQKGKPHNSFALRIFENMEAATG